jgi:hypothetical protein
MVVEGGGGNGGEVIECHLLSGEVIGCWYMGGLLCWVRMWIGWQNVWMWLKLLCLSLHVIVMTCKSQNSLGGSKRGFLFLFFYLFNDFKFN